MTMENSEIRDKAANLLRIIWKGIPADYKSRYRMTIWQQFESQVRSAAYTGSLAKFVDRLCLKLGAGIGKNAEDRAELEAIVGSGRDREILKALRDETTFICLKVRVEVQKKRDEWEALHGVDEYLNIF